MSHNLTLHSRHEEFPLLQTPTCVTDAALAIAGNAGAAVATYERWLRSRRAPGDEDVSPWDDYAPGWSWDPVTRHVAQVDAFLAFAPDARFGST